MQVETCTSIAVIPRFWNINTGYFLRRYVYERWGGGTAALAATQMVSGLWHGLREGHLFYFLFTIPMFHSSKGVHLAGMLPCGKCTPLPARDSAPVCWLSRLPSRKCLTRRKKFQYL